MNDERNNTVPFGKTLTGLLAAAFVSFALLLAVSFLAAALLGLIRNCERTPYITIAAFLLLLVTGFVGGRLSADTTSLRGVYCGGLTAVIFFLLLSVLSLLLHGGSLLSGRAVLILLTLMVSGMIGGVVGAVKR